MKKLAKGFSLCLIFLILFIGLAKTTSAQNFEGVIYYEIPEMSNQGMGEMPYMIKEDKVRMEFGKGSQGGALIYMPEENKMAFILEAMKGYMTLDVEESESFESEEEENTDMSQTGDTKTIAGRSCEVWQVISQDNSFLLCVAKGFGNFMMPKNPMARSNTPQWAKEAMEGGFMPLEVVEVTGNTTSLKMRATKIEEKSLSDSLFEIPEGYQDMSQMMKQMMDGNN